MALVAEHADIWNCPIYALDRFDELRDAAGDATPSIQEMVAFVPGEAQRQGITELTQKRFGQMADGLAIGSGSELVEHFGERKNKGIDRFYIWCTDFASPETLEGFGASVIAGLG
jgi:hypothetical protein